jgi:hypothetical protein
MGKTCADLGANCGSANDGCGNMLDCGTCTGTDGCGAGGTPNVCDNAVTIVCGACPAGYNLSSAMLADTVCDPADNCFNQTPHHNICTRGNVIAGCGGGSCAPSQHLANSYVTCQCTVDICVSDL